MHKLKSPKTDDSLLAFPSLKYIRLKKDSDTILWQRVFERLQCNLILIQNCRRSGSTKWRKPMSRLLLPRTWSPFLLSLVLSLSPSADRDNGTGPTGLEQFHLGSEREKETCQYPTKTFTPLQIWCLITKPWALPATEAVTSQALRVSSN